MRPTLNRGMPATEPLRGIRVVEQGTFITGPCAGMMLADLGADVIKIEGPDGDPFRRYLGTHYSPHFQAYNRNKRSIALDLKNPDDRRVLDSLVSQADVFIQNFRPGTAAKLGAGPERLRELNSRLIYCSISGFGPSGPYAGRPSYDSVAQALSGFLSVAVDEERPQFLGPAIADAVTGIYASNGILAALVRRSVQGSGGLVEVSMLEAMTHFSVEPLSSYLSFGQVPKSSDRPRLAQAHILKSSDHFLIAIHLSSLDKFWIALAEALQAPELIRDARFASRQLRIDNYEQLSSELAARFAKYSRDDLIEALTRADVPFAPVNGFDEVVTDPQVRHLGLMVPVEFPLDAQSAVRPPFQFDQTRSACVRAAPSLDQHGAAIREALARDSSWPRLVLEGPTSLAHHAGDFVGSVD